MLRKTDRLADVRYQLLLEDGEPAVPHIWHHPEPDWQAGDTIIAMGNQHDVLRVEPGADETRVLIVRPAATA